MKIIVQRVTHASVTVDGIVRSAIAHGIVLLAGFSHDDTEKECAWCARRIAGLRLCEDANGKMNLSVKDTGGAVLAIPQFTVYGNCAKGRRPDFTAAAPPEKAAALFDTFCSLLKNEGMHVEQGVFQTHMHVELCNDGPVTLLVEREPE